MNKFEKNKNLKLFNANLNNEIKSRKKKLEILRKNSHVFMNNFKRNSTSNKLYLNFKNKNNEELKKLNINVSLIGRIISNRTMGKASFITLQDCEGIIQLYISKNNLEKKIYNIYYKLCDLGDIINVYGVLFKTKTKELTVRCSKIYIVTKSLRPLPNKFHGLLNQDICYRQRYLDLISNKKTYEVFKIRSKIIYNIRNFMYEKNFMEVETPMMQTIPGGAVAKPFKTYHNDLNLDIYLRISPELYLKQLVIGGFERIFEINRNFRNEGLSRFHNPEFTMMELYIAYSNYKDLMSLIENLFYYISIKIFGTHLVKYNGITFDFSKSFKKISMKEAINFYNPEIKISVLNEIYTAKKLAQDMGIIINKNWKLGKIQYEIFEKTTIKYLKQPTFITHYPSDVSPLARPNDKNKFIADRFELFIYGNEIGNGFSELNDSIEQSNKFSEQIKNDCNTNKLFNNKEYITALEYGLPPTAGLGIGIDRLVMIFTNSQNIKDVILFPTMRPKI
ncbi:MAG: lysine--tRNA ligase [Enterobacterales bacterium]